MSPATTFKGWGAAFKGWGGAISRDPFWWVFTPLYVVLQLPYFWPGLSEDRAVMLGDRWGNFVLMPIIMGILWGRSRRSPESAPWRLLTAAMGMWWLQEIVALVLLNSDPTLYGFLSDGLFGLYYLFWFLAAGVASHSDDGNPHIRWVRAVRSAGTGVVVAGLGGYLSVAPARLLESDFGASWVPSLYLFFILDVMLVLRFGFLARQLDGRSRLAAWLLTLYCGLTALLDLTEALMFHGVFDLNDIRANLIWSLPFVVLVLAARCDRLPWPEGTRQSPPLTLRLLGQGNPLVSLAFVVPLFHFSFHLLDWGVPEARGVRETMALILLLVLCSFAAIENVLLLDLKGRADREGAELERLREEKWIAEQADGEKTQFLSNVSHEIRTPMNEILGMVGLLSKGRLAPQARNHIQTIKASADGLLHIFEDILDYSRIEKGGLDLKPAAIEVSATVSRVVDMFAPGAQDRGIELVFEPAEDLPDRLTCDPYRLRQVLLNLLANALKFTAQGGRVTVRLEVLEASDEIRFSVADTGLGIAADRLVSIFEPFVQADQDTGRQFGGSGLGLAICRRLIEAMGGEIQVASVLGHGSTFEFTLPLTPSWPEPSSTEVETAALADRPRISAVPVDPSSLTVEPAAPVSSPPACCRGHVLLVEDNAINQLVTLHLLADLGFEAQLAHNGHEALEAMASTPFDVVLMDCQMPDLDGYEATRRWRRQESTESHLPIIAVTAHAFEEDRVRCRAAGMDDFLSKPFDGEGLRRALERWCGC